MAPAACHSGSTADVASAYWSTVVGRATANAVVAGRATGSTVGVGEGSRIVVATAGGRVRGVVAGARRRCAMTIAATTSTTTPMIAGISQRAGRDAAAARAGAGRGSVAGERSRGPRSGCAGGRPGVAAGIGAVGGFGCIACQFEIGGVGGPAGRSGPGRPVSLIGAPPCITSPEPSPDARSLPTERQPTTSRRRNAASPAAIKRDGDDGEHEHGRPVHGLGGQLRRVGERRQDVGAVGQQRRRTGPTTPTYVT